MQGLQKQDGEESAASEPFLKVDCFRQKTLVKKSI
jgi:hypothetical protein